jgi:sugar phosphate isomerase/epimerase
MLENVYEEEPEEMRPLFESLHGSGVRFCFDPGHQSAFSTASFDSWLGVLGSFLGQVHLHDNQGDRDAHLAMGDGVIPFERLFDYLSTTPERSIVITLEPHEEAALWPSLAYLQRYMKP